MADCMTFPKMWEQFLHDYEFEDGRRIYTNGARLIPSFRVKQMMEHYLLEAKTEAYREFAEQLEHAEYGQIDGEYKTIIYTQDDIDNALKELTESKNDFGG